jgi:hypothetical protein
MLRRKTLALLLVAALTAGLAGTALAAGQNPVPGPKADHGIPDWAEAEWAFGHMARMRFMNVMKGYEDGKFRPNAAISQAEALVMVIRMLDAEAAAQALSNAPLVFPGANWIWARGYIKYALDRNWITLEDFNPNRAASRLWVATLLVKAFAAGAADAAQLAAALAAFSDIAELTGAEKGFIAVAYARGWILGYPDGTFKPHKPVTRAEMAALLDRGEGILPRAYHGVNAKGLVISVDVPTKSITIVKSGETTAKTYVLAANALISGKGHGQLPLTDVTVLDYVHILLDASGNAVVVTVDNRKVVELTATVVSKTDATSTSLATITLAYGGVTKTFDVSADVLLKKADGSPATWADIVAGVVVEANVKNKTLVVEIQIKPTT